LDDRHRAAVVARHARELAETKYSEKAYLERTRDAYAALFARRSTVAGIEDLA